MTKYINFSFIQSLIHSFIQYLLSAHHVSMPNTYLIHYYVAIEVTGILFVIYVRNKPNKALDN